jgi:hypothetical protein
MDPTVKGYFRLSATQYGLIKHLTVHSALGIRNKRYVSFTVWVWDNPQFEGQPSDYSVNNVTDWYVMLPDAVTTVAEVEHLCIDALMTRRTLNTPPELKARRVARRATYWGEGQSFLFKVSAHTLVEVYTRTLPVLLLRLATVELTYSVTHTTRKGEEVYSDSLSYRGLLTPVLQSTDSVGTLHQRIANHFLYKYHGIVTS